MSDDTFSYQEMRIALTAFASWFANENGLVLLKPAATVDRFLEETL
jgi:hypothetical protein